MIYENLLSLIGNTPIISLANLKQQLDLKANLFAKVEFFNPCHSVKDRIAHAMIRDAEEKGVLQQDTTIIEPTSGNTGIGLAFVCAIKKYHLILTMPESMSAERRKLLKALGANFVLTEGAKGMKGAIEKANELHAQIPNSIILSQFTNKANVKIHYETTGPEIFKDFGEKIDVLVSGVGTGGTITGVGRYLKEKVPNIKIVAVEPFDSQVLAGQKPSSHKIQGIGAGFVPEILDLGCCDEIFPVKNEDAFATSALVAKTEGLLVGISSGASLFSAISKARQKEFENKNILAILPDTGERYLSTALYD